MLYKTYQNKILKVAKLRDFVWKHKIVFGAILCAIIALFGVFLCNVGNFTKPLSVGEQFVYGQKVNAESDAFFAFTSYEYTQDGKNSWSKTMPTAPGKYQVRAVSFKPIGGTIYSEPKPFEIDKKPLQVTIEQTSVTYGETPTLTAPLSYSDSFANSCQIDLEYSSGLSLTATPVLESIKITSKSNADVTDYYQITVSPKTLTVNQMELGIDLDDLSKEYDGTPLSSENYTIRRGELVFGQQLSLEFTTQITNVGNVQNRPTTISVTSPDGEDTSRFYKVDFYGGNLAVTAREISVQTASVAREYNGLPLYAPTFEITSEKGLVAGHNIVVTAQTQKTLVGNYENRLEFDVVESGNSVVHNYKVVQTCGALEITPKPLFISTESQQFIYNGEYQSYPYFTADGLIEPDTAKILHQTEIMWVGSIQNKLVLQVTSLGEDRTSCYEMQYTYGSLQVQKRQITARPQPLEKVYDGDYLQADRAQIIVGDLPFGHNFKILQTSAKIKNVASVTNAITDYKIVDDKNSDVTQNYDVTLENGSLQITKREASITVVNKEKIYDAIALESAELATDNLVERHSVSNAVLSGSITNAGTVDNQLTDYDIVDADGESVKENYQISVLHGLLTVAKRPITVQATSITKVYDGAPTYSSEYQITSGSLASGQSLEVTAYGSATNLWDDNVIYITDYEIYGANGEVVTENYVVTTQNGEINITARPITVATAFAEKIYDGTPLFDHGFAVTQGSLVSGHDLSVISGASQTDYGQVFNSLNYLISHNGQDLTANYLITEKAGILNVVKRTIVIEILGAEKTYDGTPLTCADYDIESGTLVSGHVIVVKNLQAQTDVGSVENSFDVQIMHGVTDKTFCYEVDFNYSGDLTVTARQITVKPVDMTKVYDGTPLIATVGELTATSPNALCVGHSIQVETNKQITNVGQTNKNKIEQLTIVDFAGRDVTANYDVSFERGTLEVTKRPLVITVVNKTKEYDGEPLTSTEVDCNNLAPNQTVAGVTTSGSITEIGSAENNLTAYSIVNAQNEQTTDNYEISVVNGTLTITKRFVTVTTADHTAVYDGTFVSNPTFVLNKEIAGHNYNVLTFEEQMFVGTYQNVLTLGVTDKFGHDVSAQYEFTYVYGTLEITERVVALQTANDGKTYDGVALFNKGYQITGELGVAEGDQISVIAHTEIIDVGIAQNVLDLRVLCDGQDRTQNYLFEMALGNLVVSPRKVLITTQSSQKTYDALPFNHDEYTAEVNFENGEGQPCFIGASVVSVNRQTQIVDVGEYENKFELAVSLGGADKTFCYHFDYVYGTLTVLQRQITVKPTDEIKEFDGTPLTSVTGESAEGQLCEGHSVTVVSSKSQTEVGVVEDNQAVSAVIISENGADVSANYQITLSGYSRLEVTPIQINIKPLAANVIYTGEVVVPLNSPIIYDKKPLSGYEFFIEVESRLNGEPFNAVEVGDYEIAITAIRLEYNGVIVEEISRTTNAGGNLVIDYGTYVATLEDFILRINPRKTGE